MSDPIGQQEHVPHEQNIEDSLEDSGDVGFTNTAITNASVAHALAGTFSNTAANAALDALGGKINSILTALRNNGIVHT